MNQSLISGKGWCIVNIYFFSEADILAEIIRSLLKLSNITPSSIGVIAPYNAQVSLLKQILEEDDSIKGMSQSKSDKL